MAQRITTAEKPAPKRHLGRMGCLVIIGVVLLGVVSTVFAPDFPRQASSPSVSPSAVSTAFSSATLSVASTPEVTFTAELSRTEPTEALPAASITAETPTATRLSATPEGKPATQIAIPSPRHTATAFLTPTWTPSPTPTPTVALILATNTHPPLILVTNTPFSSGE